MPLGKEEIDNIRKYFMNTRSNILDTSTSSSISVELDISFQKLLQEKEQICSKMNNPLDFVQLNESSTSETDAIETNSRVENDNDEEEAAMNRLLNDFVINDDQTQLLEIGEPSYFSKISPVKAVSMIRPSTVIEESQSWTTTSCSRSSSSSSLGGKGKNDGNDTLEDVEYIRQYPDKYVLRPVVKRSQHFGHQTPEKRNDDVILIESSPEISFDTAASANEMPDRGASKSMRESKSIQSSDADESKSSFATAASTFGLSDVAGSAHTSSLYDAESKLSDADDSEEKENQNLANFINKPMDFNDTIEEMEYMMEQGRKLLEQKITPKTTPNQLTLKAKSSIRVSPSSNKSAGKANSARSMDISPPKNLLLKTPNSAVLRSKQNNSPSTSSKIFKKPEILSMRKVPNSTSKIPRPAKHNKFDHIVSPVGAYINSAQMPLQQNVKPIHNFLDSSFCAKVSRELDFSVMSANESIAGEYTCSLPKKAYIKADKCYLLDERKTKTPGGEKIMKLIGNQPVIIREEGKVNKVIRTNETELMSDTLADLSVMQGDVSLKVILDVKRM